MLLYTIMTSHTMDGTLTIIDHRQSSCIERNDYEFYIILGVFSRMFILARTTEKQITIVHGNNFHVENVEGE